MNKKMKTEPKSAEEADSGAFDARANTKSGGRVLRDGTRGGRVRSNPPSRTQGKIDSKKAQAPKPATWPVEYARLTVAAPVSALGKDIAFSSVHTIPGEAMILDVDVVPPTDGDDEFFDGAQNAYKLLKSMTSGARFYTQNTMYYYRYMYRLLVAILADTYGYVQSLIARIPEDNCAPWGAFNLKSRSSGNSNNFTTEMQVYSRYTTAILEMVSEINSLPAPMMGDLESFFTYFSHIYRDDRGVNSDYYLFNLKGWLPLTYDDSTKTYSTAGYAAAPSGFQQQLQAFYSIVTALRDSVDTNNLMADMIAMMPNSRTDWMDALKRHAGFLANLPEEIGVQIANVSVVTSSSVGTDAVTGNVYINSVDTLGDNASHAIATPKGDRWVVTDGKVPDVHAMRFSVSKIDTTKVANTGMFVGEITVCSGIGSVLSHISSSDKHTLTGMAVDMKSSVQATAEDGGLRLMQTVAHFRHVPAVVIKDYGSSSSASLLTKCADRARYEAYDIGNNIKVINQSAYSTTHITTERPR